MRVSDQGGGIMREEVPAIFRYHYTTATAGSGAEPGRGGLQSPAHPMHGLGNGMPLNRVYTRYFGSDLDLLSMLGHSNLPLTWCLYSVSTEFIFLLGFEFCHIHKASINH